MIEITKTGRKIYLRVCKKKDEESKKKEK